MMSLNPKNGHTVLKRAVNYPQAHTIWQGTPYEKVQLRTINTFTATRSDTAAYKPTSRVTGIFSSLGFCQKDKSCSP